MDLRDEEYLSSNDGHYYCVPNISASPPSHMQSHFPISLKVRCDMQLTSVNATCAEARRRDTCYLWALFFPLAEVITEAHFKMESLSVFLPE